MNLYEYSQKFNREAGYMFQKSTGLGSEDGEDCLAEIKQIISGSEIVLASVKVVENGFDFSILNTIKELIAKKSQRLSKFFTTKNFTPFESPEGYNATCIDFYDQINVVISNRASIYPIYPEVVVKKVMKHFKNIPEDRFSEFRTYTDIHHNRLTVYAKKGEFIPDVVYKDREYAKSLEAVLMTLCKELDTTYKKVMTTV
jgi:hypothetical protein